MGIRAEKHEYGVVACSLNGATTYEKSLFLDALQELLSGIDNPRYLMIRKSPLGPFMRKDYLAIPTLLGRNKKLAQYSPACGKDMQARRGSYTQGPPKADKSSSRQEQPQCQPPS